MQNKEIVDHLGGMQLDPCLRKHVWLKRFLKKNLGLRIVSNHNVMRENTHHLRPDFEKATISITTL
jgi:hypothetical protein